MEPIHPAGRLGTCSEARPQCTLCTGRIGDDGCGLNPNPVQVRREGSVMPLSVEAALQLEVFTRTAVQIFAGQENLSRSVRWVHPVEIPDIGQFLTGGEMLLTAG